MALEGAPDAEGEAHEDVVRETGAAAMGFMAARGGEAAEVLHFFRQGGDTGALGRLDPFGAAPASWRRASPIRQFAKHFARGLNAGAGASGDFASR